MGPGVVFGGDQQVLEVENVGLVPLVVRLLEVLVHLDGVERAIFGQSPQFMQTSMSM